MTFSPRSGESCRLCGSRELTALFIARDHRFKVAGSFPVAQCRGCGVVLLHPMPSPDVIEAYYALEDHYPYALPTFSRTRRLKNGLLRFGAGLYFGEGSGALRTAGRALLRPLRGKLIPRSPFGGRLLDIGCGNGTYLLVMKAVGWGVYGCELSRTGAAAAQRAGLPVVRGTVHSAAYPDAYFDVVRLEHVFEHIEDPAVLLKEIRRIIKPDGLLMIGVPHGASLSFRVFGQHWGLLGAPFHLYHYSLPTLSALLKRSGFRVVRRRFLATPQCWLWSVNNYLNARYQTTREVGFVYHPVFVILCRLAVFPLIRLMYVFHPHARDMMQVVAQVDR